MPCLRPPTDQEGAITEQTTSGDARTKPNPLISCGDERLAQGQSLNSAGRNVHPAEGMQTVPGVAWEREMSSAGTGSCRESGLRCPNTFSSPGEDAVTVSTHPHYLCCAFTFQKELCLF